MVAFGVEEVVVIDGSKKMMRYVRVLIPSKFSNRSHMARIQSFLPSVVDADGVPT